MADNFDLKKFLKESKALENLNPLLRKENLNEGDLRSKIREYIIAELGNNPSDYDYEEEDIYRDYDDDDSQELKRLGVYDREDEPVDYDLDLGLMEEDPGEEEADMMDAYADGGFLDEAKKDKKEEEEVTDVEVTDTETEEAPAEEAPAEEAPAAEGGLEDIAANMEGTESELMKNLMDALKIAKGMGNEKLETQIGNTLKFFVSEYIGGSEQ
jgi:hypothetical protein